MRLAPRAVLALHLLCLMGTDTPAIAAPEEPQQQEQQYGSVEERRIMEAMQAGGDTRFAEEREKLEQREKDLKRLESEVDKKIEQLNQLRKTVEQLLRQKEAEEQKRVTELAKMYEKMSADKAAAVIGTLDTGLAISILRRMKIKSSAKILGNMERTKAASLTTAFSTLDTR